MKPVRKHILQPLCLSQDVLYAVCNPVGNVLRIVIFRRNGIQAMVEYPECLAVRGLVNMLNYVYRISFLSLAYWSLTSLRTVLWPGLMTTILV